MKIDSQSASVSGSPEAVSSVRASPPVYWSEKVVLALVSIHLIFLPWALGTMHLRSQLASLALAGVGFLAAVLLNPPSTHVIPKIPAWKKLVRSPVVWLGILLLGYILTQALNPAFRQIVVGDLPFLVPVDHISWLPSGMETPLAQMSPFRHLIIFGALFLTVWTILLFLERPKSIRFLFMVLTYNGVALAILAFAQLFSGADQIFWKISSPNDTFYSSFIYRNHTSSYLNLLLALSIGLYFHYRERAWKTNRSEPDKSPIFFFTSTILFTTVLFSGSRGGVIAASLLLLAAIFYTFIQAWRWNRLRETSVISTIFLGLLVLFASVFTAVIGPDRIIERFKQFGREGGDFSVESRMQATRATADMFRDNWLWGWGAGSFEYAFPTYQQNYPEIHYRMIRKKKQFMLWEYAHNDWVQYPAEYGVAGMALFLAGLLGWLASLIRFRGLRHPIPVWVGLAVLVTLAHGFGDFVLQNPAIVITLAAAMGLGLRASVLENARRRRRAE